LLLKINSTNKQITKQTMTIQFNTDKALKGEKRQEEYFSTQIANGLERFESHISRIEVHLKDENGKKDGFNDISCLMEARIEGKQPIAVSNQADSVELAINGAIDKMTNAMNSIVGKMQAH
jgi:ribosome-associated translation inhibitor RaiA